MRCSSCGVFVSLLQESLLPHAEGSLSQLIFVLFLVGPVSAFSSLKKLHKGVLKMNNVNLKYSYIVFWEKKKRQSFCKSYFTVLPLCAFLWLFLVLVFLCLFFGLFLVFWHFFCFGFFCVCVWFHGFFACLFL